MRVATMSWLRSILDKCLLILAVVSATSTGIFAAKAEELTFVLRIKNGQVEQSIRLIRVKQGDDIKLQWSADRPMILHLHGYDIEKKIAPNVVTEMSFNARATGRFTIAPHIGKVPSGDHAHGEALVTIEVYPR